MELPHDPSTPLDPTECSFVLVEDDRILRDLLREMLRQRFQPKSLFDFETGRAALAHCQAQPPHVLVTDLRLPDIDGRELIQLLSAKNIRPRVLVMTGLRDSVLPAELIAMGVAGFVDKASSWEDYERALHRVLRGGMYFTADTTPRPTAVFNAREDSAGSAVLSEIEREVARLVSGGLSSKEIGTQLNLGTRTVEKMRARIMEKIGARDLTALVRWSLRNGLG